MAVGLAAILMFAALCGRQHERSVLNGARAIEDMPVGFPGRPGEGRGNGEKRATRFRQRTIERGKTQIIADRKPDPAPRQIGRHGDFTRTVAARFAVAFALTDIYVEHMNLIVAGDDLACGVDQKRTVCRFVRRKLDGQ